MLALKIFNSVKVCCKGIFLLQILWSHSLNTNAGIQHPLYAEQDTNTIITSIGKCFQALADDVDVALLSRIAVIGR